MTAQEAKNKADSFNSVENSSQLKEILAEIEKSAGEGDYGILWYAPLENRVQVKLESLGYSVVNNNNWKDGTSIYISWRY